LTYLTNLTYDTFMNEPLVSTIDFSPAKATLSDVMNEVFHQHRPHLVSRHNGKEQMLLVRPEDLVALLGDQRLDVRAVYDEGEVTLSIPDMGVLGFGETLDEASQDLLDKLRAYVARFFQDPTRYMATSRRAHAGALLRFALAGEDGQRSMLGFDEPEPQREVISSAR
jgi:Antitoxin of toxin-antitoxin, RelE / RelB, TA system